MYTYTYLIYICQLFRSPMEMKLRHTQYFRVFTLAQN